jgi:maleate isomerase
VHVDFIAHVGVPLVVSQGPEFMRRFLGQIEAQTGLPASTTINSAKEALRSLGARKIIVLTPFPPETHQRVVSFLAAEGFAVEAEARMEANFKDLTLIGEREVFDFMTRAVRRGPKVDAVFAPCPQWHAFELTRFLELDTGLPFVTGDGCDFWYAFRTLGIRGVKPGYGILLDRLSASDKPEHPFGEVRDTVASAQIQQ